MTDICRKWTIFSAVILTIIGTILSIAAILTPSWQIVNLREYNSIHKHGLWLDCTQHTRDGNVMLRRYSTVTEPLHCVYKFDYDKYSGTFDIEDDNSPVGEVNRHKFYGWHTATLILLALALLTSFLSICIGACGCCYASLSLVFTVITLLTTFLSSVAEGVFFFFSHRADNRFIKGIVGTYEQRVGFAFFLQMAACFFHFVAFLISMLSTYFAFTIKGGALDRYSIQNSSKTNMTNVGRKAIENEYAPQFGYSDSISGLNREQLNPLMNAPPSFHSRLSDYPNKNLTLPFFPTILKKKPLRILASANAYCPTTRQPLIDESVEGSLFRSMEFEHPIFIQNPKQSQRQQYYPNSKAEEFDRAVADSMPELNHARSYQSDILPPRVRRKSETCV